MRMVARVVLMARLLVEVRSRCQLQVALNLLALLLGDTTRALLVLVEGRKDLGLLKMVAAWAQRATCREHNRLARRVLCR